MATATALGSVTQAVSTLLGDAAAAPSPIGFGLDTTFIVVDADNVADVVAGAGIYPYRVSINGTYRRPHGGIGPNGRQRLPKLPVDLHLLVLVRMSDPGTQVSLAGWIMRKLEDHPVLPLNLLNADDAGAFALGETVELAFTDLPHEELLHVKEVLGPETSDLLILPYVARAVPLESALDMAVHPEVQQRDLDFATLGKPT